jgi:site-specific DNA-methyltransferase (adenine-specific)
VCSVKYTPPLRPYSMSEPTVRRRRLSEYRPDPANANAGSERGAAMVNDSLRRSGAGRSLVSAADDTIVAGSTTLEAAADAGFEHVIEVETTGDELVVVKRRDWPSSSDPRAARYAVVDNRSAELGLTWDRKALQALQDQDQAILAGLFTAAELTALLRGGSSASTPSDDTPDPTDALQARWGVQPGDLWQIGPHRLLCGNSQTDLPRLLGETRPAICHADPPYGEALLTTRASLGKSQSYRPVIGDDQPFDPRPYLSLAPQSIWWGANHYAHLLPPSPFWLVWDKQGGAKDTTFATCELAWCSDRQPARVLTHVWDGFRRDSEQGIDRFHPTQKPIAVLAWALSWLDGETIVEPFMGSGSTLLAAHTLGRVCYGCELYPPYCAVTLQRAADAGLDPVRLSGL